MASAPFEPVEPPQAALTRAMAADGVDLSDQAAGDAWIDDFSALPPDERRRILVRAQSPVPPMHLPDTATLAVAALATRALRQLAGFVAWVVDGRPVTPQCELTLADGRHLADELDTGDRVDQTIAGRTFTAQRASQLPGLDLVVRVARSAWLTRRHRGTVVRTDRGSRLVELIAGLDGPDDAHDALDIWTHVVVALLDLGTIDVGRHDRSGMRWWVAVVDHMVVDLLAALAMQGRRVHAEAVEQIVVQRVVASEEIDSVVDLQRAMVPQAVADGVAQLLERLAWLGLITLEDVTTHTDHWGMRRAIGGQIRLAPLGRWLLRPLLLDHGYEVPLAGEHADAPADVLLDALEGWPPETFAAEVRSWAQARAAAADELAMAALDATSPGRCGLVFTALAALGDPAELAVRALMASPDLRPFAVMWLIEHGFEPPEFFDPADAPSGLIQMLAAVLINEGVDAVCDTKVAQDTGEANLSLIEELWRVDDPHTAPVLRALSSSPVRPVAKAARRSLFKHRNVNRE